MLDRLQTKEVLRATLHAILFHRLFGTVRPRTFEVLDVTMVSIPSLLSYGRVSVSIVGICADFEARSSIYALAEAYLRDGGDGDRRAPRYLDGGCGWRCEPGEMLISADEGCVRLAHQCSGTGAGFGFYARRG